VTRLFNRTTNWIVDWPVVTILLITVITVTAIAGHVAPERILAYLNPPAEQEQAVAQEDEEMEAAPAINPFSVSDANAIVVVESDSFFTPSGARTLRQVVAALEEIPYVRSVVWMDRVPTTNIFGLREPLLPPETAAQERFDNAREKSLRSPLLKGQFLSEDGQTTLLLVNFDFFFVESNDDCIGGLRRVAEKAAAEASDIEIQFSVTGRTPLYITAREQNETDVLKFQLIGYGMIVLMSLVLFRGFSAVAIVAIAPALGVFWTLGILPYFELQDNPFNNVLLPVLVSLVGLTDGVHLMVHIRKLRASGLSPREAARQGIHEVGLACALTSLTTAIGFGSLVLASHEVVREFGWCCVVGVTLTFVSVVTTIPLLCSSWLGRRVHHGLEKSLIDKNLSKIGNLVDFVLRHAKVIGRTGVAVTLGLVLLSLTLKPDERRTEGLPTRSEPVVALKKMDAALGGLELAYVDIHWTKSVDSGSAEILEVVTEVDDLLRTEELVGHPLSIRNLIDSLPGDSSAGNRMPMLELLPPPLKRAFYVPERREATVSFRVQDVGIAKYGPVFQRLTDQLQSIDERHPDFDVGLSDRGAVWRWNNLYTIVVDFVRSLSSAAFVIFIVLTIVYRSLRIGLISIVPNLFPLVLSASFLVVTGQYLEMVSVCTFLVCLGIAVDDTIHFLTRYQEELRKTNDEELAIRNAFTSVGTALIMTTVVLLAGFATVMLSESREHRIFGWMGGITIASALFADLTFLPALLSRFGRSKRSDSPIAKTESSSTSSTAFPK